MWSRKFNIMFKWSDNTTKLCKRVKKTEFAKIGKLCL